MSLLLDALRKSENQRRKGELPSLDQPLSMPVMSSQPPSSKLRWLLAVLLLAVVVVAAAWWWTSAPINQPTVAAETVAERPSMEPAPNYVEQPSSGAQPLVQTQPIININTPTAADSRSLPMVSNEVSTGSQPGPETVDEQPADTETVDQEIETAAVTAAEPAAVTAAEPEAQTELTANYIYAWELPLDARQDFPELNLTVHVFTSDPASRFVLINDERYGEGEQLAPGVVLDEITREGAIVDYRSYRILLQ